MDFNGERGATVLSFAKVDYMTVSLGHYRASKIYERMAVDTTPVLNSFASILPQIYKDTCRDMACSGGMSKRVSQYGIAVSLQYGTAVEKGWAYSVQLSGDYWHAINYDRDLVIKVLALFEDWKISRLDLACDMTVPLTEWKEYYQAAFAAWDYTINGRQDGRTVYYGSRKSQFFTRVYNKTANDPKHYPAQVGEVYARFEVEIKRVRGEKILEPAFLMPDIADNLLLQRIREVAGNDSTDFIKTHFDNGDKFDKIKTVQRITGDFEKTVDYVFSTYAPYIQAGLKNKKAIKMYQKQSEDSKRKTAKVLAVLKAKQDKSTDSAKPSK